MPLLKEGIDTGPGARLAKYTRQHTAWRAVQAWYSRRTDPVRVQGRRCCCRRVLCNDRVNGCLVRQRYILCEETPLNGVNPYAYMQLVAGQMNTLTTRSEIETVLDELEYLFEVIPPELQDNAETLIGMLREKLANDFKQ